MKYREFLDRYIKVYKLDGFLDYYRCTRSNLLYKKVLIYILRNKFHLSYPQIADIFHNDHSTIIFHYNDVIDNLGVYQEVIDDAWNISGN